MRLLEIDNNITVEKIVEHCEPYLTAVDFDTRCIPRRDLGQVVSDDTKFVKTLEKRVSLVYSDGHVKQLIEKYLNQHNIASRYEHALIASSRGENTFFNMREERTAYVIPVGEFKMAYIEKDFNYKDTNMEELKVALFFFLNSSELKSERSVVKKMGYIDKDDEDDLKDIRHRFKYGNKIHESFKNAVEQSTLETIYDNLNSVIVKFKVDLDDKMKIRLENIKTYAEKLANQLNKSIKTDDLKSAFKTENEIWFNCEGYFAIPPHSDDWKKLVEYIQETRNK